MDEFDDLAGGDEQRANLLRAALADLRTSANPVVREMATAVQNGDLTLRAAIASGTYGDELATAFDDFWTTYQEMTPEGRDSLAEQASA
ncbi:hypothetical protein V6V47_18365 [Micromonospora sp. CPCC 205539]|uniref:hypothetical protein n=1 Tax=Micromonospora sp. CPCC 205539 TaxID=3122408 RepID=UPI002FF30F71